MNNEHTNDTKAVVVAQETVSFGGMLLDYRLLACQSPTERFRICITSGSERVESVIGSDIEFALRAYRMILQGRVTPCALEDVMYDLKSV